jgi:predicted nucleotidyltransferase
VRDIPSNLLDLARHSCLPYLLDLPRFAECADQLTILLVGSVATGLCREDSDIDIAILCGPDVYDSIAVDTNWREGRPSQTEIQGTTLHYYAETFERLNSQLRSLNDVSLYVYGSAILLHDPKNQYARRFAWLADEAESLRKERLEGKLDMLLRRSRALDQVLRDPDTIVLARMTLELITRASKIAALLDSISCDPRKRLFQTALSGITGRRIEPLLRDMLSAIGDLASCDVRQSSIGNRLRSTMAQVVDALSREAATQHFRVGLDAPDGRQLKE